MRIYSDYDLKVYPFCRSFKILNRNLFGCFVDDKIDKHFLNEINELKWYFRLKSKKIYGEISERFFNGCIKMLKNKRLLESDMLKSILKAVVIILGHFIWDNGMHLLF